MTAMAFARERFVRILHLPTAYRAGKVSDIGKGKTKRETVLDIRGPGVLRRIWTTHVDATHVKLHVFVDGDEKPVLSGFAHELAQAAEKICCEQIPLGGFYDHSSSNLYIPIPFARSLRMDAEPEGEVRDGPYWQVDYSLGCQDAFARPLQSTDERGAPIIACEVTHVGRPQPPAPCKLTERDIELARASPHNLLIDGGGIIRRIEISGKALDSLLLRMAFDHDRRDDDRLDGPFQVDAPLRYLVGPFSNACVERLGSRAVIHFPMPFRRRASIQLLAAVDYGSFSERYHFNVRIHHEAAPPPEPVAYFHARHTSAVTNGYDDFECCSTRGKGHFVGVHVFDTGHDHGGGDNMLFDAGVDSAGQLHGICGEDYFHMAYMRIWNLTPFSGSPSHSARYRYHLEMPVPFNESFVFNWGSFASQPANAVAFWYQDRPAGADARREPIYTVTGPFDLARIDDLSPGKPFPPTARPCPGEGELPRKSWRKAAQQGFLDLCHAYRRYLRPVPPSSGYIPSGICACADMRIWAARGAESVIRLGCDDPIRLYLNGTLVFSDQGRNQPDPFRAFKVPATLREGVNAIRVIVGNTPNFNWNWNGFSLVLESDLSDDEMAFLS